MVSSSERKRIMIKANLVKTGDATLKGLTRDSRHDSQLPDENRARLYGRPAAFTFPGTRIIAADWHSAKHVT